MKANLIKYEKGEIVNMGHGELNVNPGTPIPEVILRGEEVFYVEDYDGVEATYALVTHVKI